MTWFRVGGAGIPASLKNNMNSVLNKKFGTTGQNYPPNGWPDDVNLLGPLPEGTASGSIANFSDGADDVPTKSLVVTIPASLSGVSSVTETQTGRNFIPLLMWYTAGYEYTNNGVTFKVLADGGIKITGKSTSSYSQLTITSYSTSPQTEQQLQVPTGTYTFSLSGIVDGIRVITSGSGNNGFPYSEITYTNQSRSGSVTDGTKPFNYLLLRVYPTDNNLDVTVYLQLELGSTAHAYEAYNATQYTASLGRTIYGGEVDIVNGTGTDENGNDFTFTGQEVPTRLGYNAFWSDEGDTEVTYRQDIALALQAVSSSRGLMMASRPVTQLVGEESDPDQVNELNEEAENTEEQEGDNDAR